MEMEDKGILILLYNYFKPIIKEYNRENSFKAKLF